MSKPLPHSLHQIETVDYVPRSLAELTSLKVDWTSVYFVILLVAALHAFGYDIVAAALAGNIIGSIAARKDIQRQARKRGWKL